MNARTSRLIRRLAHVVSIVEARAAAANGKSPMTVAPYAAQLASLKQAWNNTPRPQRHATRLRLVGIFHNIEGAARG